MDKQLKFRCCSFDQLPGGCTVEPATRHTCAVGPADTGTWAPTQRSRSALCAPPEPPRGMEGKQGPVYWLAVLSGSHALQHKSLTVRVTLRARWVTLRAGWVTLRARWVALRARWVTLRARLQLYTVSD